jgi:uncharacterized membrane protein YidH (DUF202 family)
MTEETHEIPVVDETDPDRASLEFSKHRTKLSTRRTEMSNRRTDMSNRRTEMSSRRTGMSFQRTRMSADRTLMGVIRTSLSMMTFGFTIYQGFRGLQAAHVMGSEASVAASFFGQALVYIGVGMLAAGIAYHTVFMYGLRRERKAMKKGGLIFAQSVFPLSVTLIVAVLLLMLGTGAILGIVFKLGPFG